MNLKNTLMQKCSWWCTPQNIKKIPVIEKELQENGSVVLVADSEIAYEVIYFKATGRIEVKNLAYTGKSASKQYM